MKKPIANVRDYRDVFQKMGNYDMKVLSQLYAGDRRGLHNQIIARFVKQRILTVDPSGRAVWHPIAYRVFEQMLMESEIWESKRM